MKYNFDEVVDRIHEDGSYSSKWSSDGRMASMFLSDELPEDRLCFFVADMDFRAPEVVTDALRGQPNRLYYPERLLDDWLYQTVIRPQLTEMLEAEGENVFDLACKARAEEKLRALFEKELSSRGTQSSLPRYRVSLPWNRIFEAAVTAEG